MHVLFIILSNLYKVLIMNLSILRTKLLTLFEGRLQKKEGEGVSEGHLSLFFNHTNDQFPLDNLGLSKTGDGYFTDGCRARLHRHRLQSLIHNRSSTWNLMNFGCWNSFKIGCHCDAATDCSHKQGKVEHENMTIPWNDWVYIKCKVRGATKKITAKIFHFVRSSEKNQRPTP